MRKKTYTRLALAMAPIMLLTGCMNSLFLSADTEIYLPKQEEWFASSEWTNNDYIREGHYDGKPNAFSISQYYDPDNCLSFDVLDFDPVNKTTTAAYQMKLRDWDELLDTEADELQEELDRETTLVEEENLTLPEAWKNPLERYVSIAKKSGYAASIINQMSYSYEEFCNQLDEALDLHTDYLTKMDAVNAELAAINKRIDELMPASSSSLDSKEAVQSQKPIDVVALAAAKNERDVCSQKRDKIKAQVEEQSVIIALNARRKETLEREMLYVAALERLKKSDPAKAARVEKRYKYEIAWENYNDALYNLDAESVTAFRNAFDYLYKVMEGETYSGDPINLDAAEIADYAAQFNSLTVGVDAEYAADKLLAAYAIARPDKFIPKTSKMTEEQVANELARLLGFDYATKYKSIVLEDMVDKTIGTLQRGIGYEKYYKILQEADAQYNKQGDKSSIEDVLWDAAEKIYTEYEKIGESMPIDCPYTQQQIESWLKNRKALSNPDLVKEIVESYGQAVVDAAIVEEAKYYETLVTKTYGSFRRGIGTDKFKEFDDPLMKEDTPNYWWLAGKLLTAYNDVPGKAGLQKSSPHKQSEIAYKMQDFFREMQDKTNHPFLPEMVTQLYNEGTGSSKRVYVRGIGFAAYDKILRDCGFTGGSGAKTIDVLGMTYHITDTVKAAQKIIEAYNAAGKNLPDTTTYARDSIVDVIRKLSGAPNAYLKMVNTLVLENKDKYNEKLRAGTAGVHEGIVDSDTSADYSYEAGKRVGLTTYNQILRDSRAQNPLNKELPERKAIVAAGLPGKPDKPVFDTEYIRAMYKRIVTPTDSQEQFIDKLILTDYAELCDAQGNSLSELFPAYAKEMEQYYNDVNSYYAAEITVRKRKPVRQYYSWQTAAEQEAPDPVYEMELARYNSAKEIYARGTPVKPLAPRFMVTEIVQYNYDAKKITQRVFFTVTQMTEQQTMFAQSVTNDKDTGSKRFFYYFGGINYIYVMAGGQWSMQSYTSFIELYKNVVSETPHIGLPVLTNVAYESLSNKDVVRMYIQFQQKAITQEDMEELDTENKEDEKKAEEMSDAAFIQKILTVEIIHKARVTIFQPAYQATYVEDTEEYDDYDQLISYGELLHYDSRWYISLNGVADLSRRVRVEDLWYHVGATSRITMTPNMDYYNWSDAQIKKMGQAKGYKDDTGYPVVADVGFAGVTDGHNVTAEWSVGPYWSETTFVARPDASYPNNGLTTDKWEYENSSYTAVTPDLFYNEKGMEAYLGDVVRGSLKLEEEAVYDEDLMMTYRKPVINEVMVPVVRSYDEEQHDYDKIELVSYVDTITVPGYNFPEEPGNKTVEAAIKTVETAAKRAVEEIVNLVYMTRWYYIHNQSSYDLADMFEMEVGLFCPSTINKENEDTAAIIENKLINVEKYGLGGFGAVTPAESALSNEAALQYILALLGCPSDSKTNGQGKLTGTDNITNIMAAIMKELNIALRNDATVDDINGMTSAWRYLINIWDIVSRTTAGMAAMSKDQAPANDTSYSTGNGHYSALYSTIAALRTYYNTCNVLLDPYNAAYEAELKDYEYKIANMLLDEREHLREELRTLNTKYSELLKALDVYNKSLKEFNDYKAKYQTVYEEYERINKAYSAAYTAWMQDYYSGAKQDAYSKALKEYNEYCTAENKAIRDKYYNLMVIPQYQDLPVYNNLKEAFDKTHLPAMQKSLSEYNTRRSHSFTLKLVNGAYVIVDTDGKEMEFPSRDRQDLIEELGRINNVLDEIKRLEAVYADGKVAYEAYIQKHQAIFDELFAAKAEAERLRALQQEAYADGRTNDGWNWQWRADAAQAKYTSLYNMYRAYADEEFRLNRVCAEANVNASQLQNAVKNNDIPALRAALEAFNAKYNRSYRLGEWEGYYNILENGKHLWDEAKEEQMEIQKPTPPDFGNRTFKVTRYEPSGELKEIFQTTKVDYDTMILGGYEIEFEPGYTWWRYNVVTKDAEYQESLDAKGNRVTAEPLVDEKTKQVAAQAFTVSNANTGYQLINYTTSQLLSGSAESFIYSGGLTSYGMYTGTGVEQTKGGIAIDNKNVYITGDGIYFPLVIPKGMFAGNLSASDYQFVQPRGTTQSEYSKEAEEKIDYDALLGSKPQVPETYDQQFSAYLNEKCFMLRPNDLLVYSQRGVYVYVPIGGGFRQRKLTIMNNPTLKANYNIFNSINTAMALDVKSLKDDLRRATNEDYYAKEFGYTASRSYKVSDAHVYYMTPVERIQYGYPAYSYYAIGFEDAKNKYTWAELPYAKILSLGDLEVEVPEEKPDPNPNTIKSVEQLSEIERAVVLRIANAVASLKNGSKESFASSAKAELTAVYSNLIAAWEAQTIGNDGEAISEEERLLPRMNLEDRALLLGEWAEEKRLEWATITSMPQEAKAEKYTLQEDYVFLNNVTVLLGYNYAYDYKNNMYTNGTSKAGSWKSALSANVAALRQQYNTETIKSAGVYQDVLVQILVLSETLSAPVTPTASMAGKSPEACMEEITAALREYYFKTVGIPDQ